MTPGDEYKKLVEAQADEAQRNHIRASQERLLAQAKAVGLSANGISKIVGTYSNPAVGLQALLEEIERREKFRPLKYEP